MFKPFLWPSQKSWTLLPNVASWNNFALKFIHSENATKIWRNLPTCFDATEGQLISKAIYGLLTSPKNKGTNLFCLLFYSSRQTNQIRPFVFWENLQLANLLFGFIWPLVWSKISPQKSDSLGYSLRTRLCTRVKNGQKMLEVIYRRYLIQKEPLQLGF